MVKNYIVIGAGLSGLNTAKKINELNPGSVVVLEKSRGVGGRMATRRTLEARFDHGAQFYRLKSDAQSLHAFWLDKQTNRHWFLSEQGDHWCAKFGMTSLAKGLAEQVEVALEKQVQSVKRSGQQWLLMSDKGEEWLCDNLIISAPLPQAINLLASISNEPFFDQEAYEVLKKISYTKALIGLVTLEEPIAINDLGYCEFESGDFFSIADQQAKGVSEVAALTLTMSASFSEKEFDAPEDLVLGKIQEAFLRIYPNAKVKGIELKKWRYCMPRSVYENHFKEMAPRLFLIGDAFGGSSLLGAIRSSEALCGYLFKK